jgi:ABC-type multidrug transport system fused ATPase/permease subunit
MHPRLFATAVAGAAVFAVCTVASSKAIEWVVDHAILPRFRSGHVAVATVVAGCAMVIIVGLVRAVGVVVRRTYAGATKFRIAEDLTTEMVQRYVDQPLSWHQGRASGDLIARAGVDVDTATEILTPLPYASGTIIMVIVSSVWLIVTDLPMGLVAAALFPLLITLNVVYQRKVEPHFERAQQHLGALSAAVHESFEGVMVVKAFGAEGREAERLSAIAAGLREARVRAVSLRATFEAILDLLPALGNIGLLMLGAQQVHSHALTVGALTSFLYMFTLLVMPLRLIGWALSQLPAALAGWERIREVLDEPLVDDPARLLRQPPAGIGVRVTDLSFGFGDDRSVLDGISATIPADSTVAVVGSTGAGKSTLLHLLAGLLEPGSGSIEVDGASAALVFQEPFLLSGTIRDNISMGRPLDDAAIERAVRLAAADEFVSTLAQGVDTVVGERGVSLSGGQRQRIALARALARNSRLLLLDDTTSALDPSTEAVILGNLRRGEVGCTTIIVASRPSTIALADEVMYLAEGRLVAQGPHVELLQGYPEYRRLVEAYETDRAKEAAPDQAEPSRSVR